MSSDQTSKDARRDALAKTIETVRSRRETLARETSATRRAVEAAEADKAEGSDAVELPRAERLAAARGELERQKAELAAKASLKSLNLSWGDDDDADP